MRAGKSILLTLVAVALTGCGFFMGPKVPDARLIVTAPLLLDPVLDREAVLTHFRPMMKSLGYWHEGEVWESWASWSRRPNKLIEVEFNWRTKPPSRADHAFWITMDWVPEMPDQLSVTLYEYKSRKLSIEAWLRWKALREALESSPIIQHVWVEVHPAVDTAPEERAFLAAATGVGLPERFREGMSAEELSAALGMGLFASAPAPAATEEGSLALLEPTARDGDGEKKGFSANAAPTDPLPPELEAASLLLRAAWRIDEGDASGAQATLDGVRALQLAHGFAMPDAFWFRQAQVHHLTQRHAEAERWALHYIEAAGAEGEHVGAALVLEKTARLTRLEGMRTRWQAEEAPRQVAEAERLSASGGRFRDPLRSGGEGPLMAALPAGWYLMGSLDGFAVHRVDIERPFAIGVHEVTIDDWNACAEAGGCARPRRNQGGGSQSVAFVSWKGTQSYVGWLSSETGEDYRLPSEVEWEYAARAGTATRYSWGDEVGVNRANCNGCGGPWDQARQSAPVGTFSANAFGLHDLHGNVGELVQDCWNLSYRGAPTDGSAWMEGDCSKSVRRGGWWGGSPWSVRSASRWFDSKDKGGAYSGFRVARNLPEQSEQRP